MWVKDPERVKKSIERYGEEFRRDLIERLLFYRCLTGRRLTAALGELTDQIVWEESTREIAGDTKTIFPPDLQHIEKVILELKPTAVIAFGKIAADAVFRVLSGCRISCVFIAAPHPAARQADTPEQLKRMAESFRKAIQ